MATRAGLFQPFEPVSAGPTLRARRKTASGLARAGHKLRELFARRIGNYLGYGGGPSLTQHAVNQADLMVDHAGGVTIGDLMTVGPRAIGELTSYSRRELNQFLAKLGLGALGSWRSRHAPYLVVNPRRGARK